MFYQELPPSSRTWNGLQSTPRKHAISRTGKKPYECERRGKASGQRDHLQSHVKTLGRNPVSVSIAGERSHGETAFGHMREYALKSRECQHWGKAFAFSTSLQDHLMVQFWIQGLWKSLFSFKILCSMWAIALEKNLISGKKASYPSAFHLFLYMEIQQDRNLMLQMKFASVRASPLIRAPCISSSYCWSKVCLSFVFAFISTTFIIFKKLSSYVKLPSRISPKMNTSAGTLFFF